MTSLPLALVVTFSYTERWGLSENGVFTASYPQSEKIYHVLSLRLMDIPILVPLLVAGCIFGPLFLSLREVRDSSGPSPGGGASPKPSPDSPTPLWGDAHTVDIDAIDIQPTVPDADENVTAA
ncbi:hypothetical protein CRI94_04095 [Longibacter salinarum]|uniref:Uncharacterized protein n=1 Tax=Longibacter salinarum TaxID=1850348 RepID=A0A2A8D0P7_9BACT|nr:hypothetical protein [Longibacter salinarum]PEN14228.1 hypothetical protein CRI94_04095 [Longibacter salinarum]